MKMPKDRSLLTALAALVGACGFQSDLRAQEELPYDWKTLTSPGPTAASFGRTMTTLDINSDGFEDLVVVDPLFPVNGLGGAGQIYILYGPTLSTSISIAAGTPTASANMGDRSIAVGDVNNDGEYDILAGATGYDVGQGDIPNAGQAHLFLGPDYRTEIVFDDPEPEAGAAFGFGVALADLDGDGLDDVVVGAPFKTQFAGAIEFPGAGQVWVWRGSDLSALPTEVHQDFSGHVSNGHFGKHVTSVEPPIPGVGRDLFVNATEYPFQPGQFGSPTGTIYRYDGTNLEWIETLPKPELFVSQYGRFSEHADVNLDGIEDLLVANFDGQAQCAILEGPDYDTWLHSFLEENPSGSGFGDSATLCQFDGDGFLDVVIADEDFTSQSGAVHVFWGPDFSSTVRIDEDFFGFQVFGFGHRVTSADFDGDGIDELVVVNKFSSGGTLYIFRRRTLQADVDQLSVSTGGTVAMTLDLPPDQSGNGYVGLLSVTDPGPGLVLGPGSYLPLQPDVLTNIGLSVLLGTPILSGFLGTLDADGDALLRLNWPAGGGAGLIGSTLRLVVLTVEQDGVTPAACSNEVTVELLP